MAKPYTTSFGKFLIELGDGANTEVFAAVCGPTQKGFQLTGTTSEVNVPDCDNPEAPAWVERGMSSFSAQIDASGVLALNHLADWRTWFLSGAAKDVRVHVNEAAANGGGYYALQMLLTNMNHTTQLGSDGNKVQLAITAQSTGPVTWTPAAA